MCVCVCMCVCTCECVIYIIWLLVTTTKKEFLVNYMKTIECQNVEESKKHPLNTWNGDWRLTGSYTATSTHFMESYIVHTHTHTFTHTHPLSHQVEQINSRLKSTGWSGRRRDHFSSYLLTLKGFFYRDKYSFHLAQQRQHKRDRERREGGKKEENHKNKHNHIEK